RRPGSTLFPYPTLFRSSGIRRGETHMRAKMLVLGSSIGSLGWGAVLPYQFAYAAETRGWGLFLAAAAASLFSLGALVAAPVAGRDRKSTRLNSSHVKTS